MKRYMDNISQLETKLAAALDKRRAEIQKQIAAQKPPSAQ
jgi:hypothetical protein